MRRLLLLGSLLLLARGVAAQARSEDRPEVREIVFDGASALSRSVLADSIVTQESRCRGLLLRPFCALTQSRFFYETHTLDAAELPRDELRIRVMYFRKGYRGARVSSEVTPQDDGEVDVVFTIDEGALTTIGSLTVEETRDVLTDRQVRSMGLPDEGGPLDLTVLDSARIRIRNALWDRGYADAVIEDSIAIDATTHEAALAVTIDPRSLAIIDTIAVEGNERVSDYTVQRVLGLRPGQLFRRTDVTAAQRRLFETEIFRQSVVRVAPTGDSAKAIAVTVREAPPRSLRLGAGFNTTDFAQSEARFVRYNFLGGARRLDMRAAVGNLLAGQLNGVSIFDEVARTPFREEIDSAFLSPTWQVGAELTQPFFLSTRNSLGLSVSAHRRIVPDIVVDRGFSVEGSVTRRMAEDFPVSAIYRFERAHFESSELYFCVNFGVCDPPTVRALRGPHRLAPFGLTARIERADDPIAPTTGWLASLELEHASRLTGSSFHHQRVAAEGSRYFRFGRSVLAGVVRGGWVRPLSGTFEALGIDVSDVGILHPRRRFLSGGARSLRGYAQNQMGPKVLTVPAHDLIAPPEDTGTPACTIATIADGTCDPNAARSIEFTSRPLGGNTLFEASVEYRFPLTRTLTGATFVDVGVLRGQRINFPPGGRSDVTPGFGIRYQSPIGPVRMDLGFRRRTTDELPVVTDLIDEDGEQRLVQLETLKRYDPHEGQGGLRRALGHLQLHLAIGEAF